MRPSALSSGVHMRKTYGPPSQGLCSSEREHYGQRRQLHGRCRHPSALPSRSRGLDGPQMRHLSSGVSLRVVRRTPACFRMSRSGAAAFKRWDCCDTFPARNREHSSTCDLYQRLSATRQCGALSAAPDSSTEVLAFFRVHTPVTHSSIYRGLRNLIWHWNLRSSKYRRQWTYLPRRGAGSHTRRHADVRRTYVCRRSRFDYPLALASHPRRSPWLRTLHLACESGHSLATALTRIPACAGRARRASFQCAPPDSGGTTTFICACTRRGHKQAATPNERVVGGRYDAMI
ncbi:hypothetical protein C8Q76DRAFT_127911 [Earliella scabrosa]|nr:hypothetical protein C8Q76DRAFT_127911 [Earliella scabrosa]